MKTETEPLEEEVLRMVHAFYDEGRKDRVRNIATQIVNLKRKNQRLIGIAEGVLACLKYPRGSEAQIRCLEEVAQEAQSAIECEQ